MVAFVLSWARLSILVWIPTNQSWLDANRVLGRGRALTSERSNIRDHSGTLQWPWEWSVGKAARAVSEMEVRG